MQDSFVLLKCVAQALLSAPDGPADSLTPDGLLAVARTAWAAWGEGREESARRAELQALAEAPAEVVREEAAGIVARLATDQPEAVRQRLALYLAQVAALVRRTQPGATGPTATGFREADDLLPLLPAGLSRFRPGDRPLPGVDWELQELLGAGGFGEVWMARNPHFPGIPPVALKFCLDERARDRLLRHEAAVLDRVMRHGRHPGLVALLHTYLSAEPPCLEYEYVAGGDLTGLIHEWHRPPGRPGPALAEQAARLMLDLAEIVGHAHRLEPPIVHRDLKPANILVQRTDDGRTALRITDFGIGGLAAGRVIEQARQGTETRQFQATALRGAHTPLYASPQQKRGEPPDPRDDVHALGVIWYQLLTGDPTAGRPGGTRWTRRLRERGVAPLMIELLGACVEDGADDRPADAAALAAELAALLGERRPAPAEKTTRAGRPKTDSRPVLHLEGAAAELYEGFAAWKALAEEAGAEAERQKQAVQRLLWRQVVRLWYQQGARPEGARVTAAGGQATGLAQVRDVVKLDLAPGQDLVGVLRAAGVSADGASRLAAAEVAEETDLTLRPAAELARNNPALLVKIVEILRESLTPAEQQEALTPVAAGKLKKGFLERATQYVASEEELFRLLEVIRPQFALARVTFTGDLEKVYRASHAPKEPPSA
jgi:tRNA A-37 threonylcarbamoyl transferase component Bud32